MIQLEKVIFPDEFSFFSMTCVGNAIKCNSDVKYCVSRRQYVYSNTQ